MMRRIAWQWESAYTRARIRLIPAIGHPADAVRTQATHRRCIVLYTIALVLLILWVLGLVTSYTAGGLLHILLVAAIVVVIYQLVTGRRAP
jgi:hypothetical protein